METKKKTSSSDLESNSAANTESDEFEGPLEGEKRKCTDVFFLVLLIASWVMMTVIGLQVNINWRQYLHSQTK
jgi:hypothetical protein